MERWCQRHHWVDSKKNGGDLSRSKEQFFSTSAENQDSPTEQLSRVTGAKDSYLIVSTLLLGMCLGTTRIYKILCRYMNQYHSISTPLNQLESVATLSVEGLYTEGRLQPGTPTFLIHYYMLTLSAAFLYLHLGLNAKSVFWKSNETWIILLALPLTFLVYFTCIALFYCCFAEQPALMAKSLGKPLEFVPSY